jgi:hypothetical protein
MRTTRALLPLAAGLLLAGLAFAHEGHEHKAMGNVTTIKEGELELQTTEGQSLTLVLDKETKYKKAKAQAASTDLKAGDRVAVTYVEKEGKKHARMVRMGTTPAPAASASPAPPAPTPKP